MTEQEKTMKKYVSAVERRLNLPRELKTRVMSDFASAIAARREEGMTDDEIYAELGTAKEAAADLNDQMAEFTYRKSPWRFAFLALAVYGGYQLLMEIFAWVLVLFYSGGISMGGQESIGIIGGADGPTAIFVTASVGSPWNLLGTGAMILLGIWGYRHFSRRKK